MKYRLGICTKCGKEKMIVKRMLSGDFCDYCNQERLNEGKEKKIYSIPKESAKRKKENKEYLKIRKEFLKANPMCQANVIDKGKLICTYKATQVHHMSGRIGKLLTNVNYFLPICDSCHRFAELNPESAKKLGLSVSRLESKQEIIPLEE